jgi:hypothetical protein
MLLPRKSQLLPRTMDTSRSDVIRIAVGDVVAVATSEDVDVVVVVAVRDIAEVVAVLEAVAGPVVTRADCADLVTRLAGNTHAWFQACNAAYAPS